MLVVHLAKGRLGLRTGGLSWMEHTRVSSNIFRLGILGVLDILIFTRFHSNTCFGEGLLSRFGTSTEIAHPVRLLG